MKTNSTLKLWMLALVMTLSVAACKKKDNPEPVPLPVEVKTLTISELKALSTGTSVKLPDARKIKGIVISDVSAKNIDTKTVILQEATDKPGLIVTFDATQTFAVGDEIEVVVSAQTLAQVNGEIVLQNVPAANAKKTGTGTITARATSIADITTNKGAWNGTLVSIGSGMFNGNGKYTGTLDYSAGNSTIKSQIASGSTFENTAYPALVNGITGIVRISGNEVLLNIRNASDVKQPETFVYVEDFSGATPALYTSLRTITTNKSEFKTPLNTAFTTKYGAKALGLFGGGWLYADVVGTNNLNRIKNTSAGSNDPDAGFLTPGRNYYSVLPFALTSFYAQLTDPTSTRYGSEWNNFSSSFNLNRVDGADDLLKGIKSITIVFAGSKMQIADFDPTSAVTTNVVYNSSFDASKDGFSANLYTSNQEKLGGSSIFRNQGVWQTVTFDDLGTKLTSLDGDGKGMRNLYLTFTSAVNQRGTLSIGRNGSAAAVAGSPIIVDKIIFEFTSKPTWAE